MFSPGELASGVLANLFLPNVVDLFVICCGGCIELHALYFGRRRKSGRGCTVSSWTSQRRSQRNERSLSFRWATEFNSVRKLSGHPPLLIWQVFASHALGAKAPRCRAAGSKRPGA